MHLVSKIKKRIADLVVDLKLRRHLDRLERSDVLLAHRIVARRRLPSPKQWRLVGRVLNPAETRAIRAAFYVIAAGALILIGRWAVIHAAFAPASGGEYREGIVGSPRAVNPILAGGNDVDQDLVRLIYGGLYRRDNEARLVLDLAEKADISSDGKTYAFTIRSDARFHDGWPVTSDDVVFTVNAILDPTWKSPLLKNLQGIKAKASDSRIVVVSTSQPSSYLPSLLTFGILPKHIWEKVDPNSRSLTDFNLKPIGSGPFKFEKFSRDSSGNILSYTLRATREGGAKLDRITFKFYDDYDTAADKLTGNAVDGLNFVPPGKREAIEAIPGIAIRAPALSQYTAVFLNPKRNAALADADIRQALALAIDRERLVREALNGLGAVRDMPIPEGTTGATAEITRYAYDPTAAAALLDKAGYPVSSETKIRTKTETEKPKTKNQIPKTTTTELAVTISTIDTDENRRAAEIIKEEWSALGVKTEIITAAAGDIQTSVIKPREYDALLFGEILGPDADPFPFWHSSQTPDGLNLAAYSNRRVDELLEKARLAPSEVERGKLLAEFQQIVTKETPAIFLYQPDYLYPQSSKIKDFDVRRVTAPADRFSNVIDWYRKLKLTFK